MVRGALLAQSAFGEPLFTIYLGEWGVLENPLCGFLGAGLGWVIGFIIGLRIKRLKPPLT